MKGATGGTEKTVTVNPDLLPIIIEERPLTIWAIVRTTGWQLHVYGEQDPILYT